MLSNRLLGNDFNATRRLALMRLLGVKSSVPQECVSVCAFIIADACGPESAATSRIFEALAP